MFKQNNLVLNITGSYGVGADGKVYTGCCPDGVDGDNHPAGSGPLYTEEGRAALGVTEEVPPDRPDETYHFVNGDPSTGYTTEPKPLDMIAATKLSAANGECDRLLAVVKTGYPSSEVESWSKQEAEARAWQANNATNTPLIDGLCAGRGIDKAELVTRIISKADAYAAVVGLVVGVRQAVEDAVTAAQDDEDEAAGRAALIAINPLAGWPVLN